MIGTRKTVKLGKRTPSPYDKRTLRLAKYIKALPPPKPADGYIDRIGPNWPMMLNDSIGDCTIAAAGHMIQQWTTYSGSGYVPPDSAILRAYEAVGGYNPNAPETDNGAVILDVLKYWRKVGIGQHKSEAFMQVNPKNFFEIAQSIMLFGNCYLGVDLPASAEDPRVDGQGYPVWEVSPGGLVGDGAPGSWGGHAIPAIGYSLAKHGGVRVVSWGQLYDVTPNFIKAYCSEAWAVVSPDWIKSATGTAPSGFALLELLNDLSLLT